MEALRSPGMPPEGDSVNLQLGRDEAAFLRCLRSGWPALNVPWGCVTSVSRRPARTSPQRAPGSGSWTKRGSPGCQAPRGRWRPGATDLEQAIFAEELALAGLPRMLNVTGLELAAHALIDHGSDRQKTDLLGPTRVGDLVWYQLFSEPGAGSDLASVTTRVDRGQVPWRVTGRKIWTSSGHYAVTGCCSR